MASKLSHKMFMHEGRIINANGWKLSAEDWLELKQDCDREAEELLSRPEVACLPRIQQPLKAFDLFLS